MVGACLICNLILGSDNNEKSYGDIICSENNIPKVSIVEAN